MQRQKKSVVIWRGSTGCLARCSTHSVHCRATAAGGPGTAPQHQLRTRHLGRQWRHPSATADDHEGGGHRIGPGTGHSMQTVTSDVLGTNFGHSRSWCSLCVGGAWTGFADIGAICRVQFQVQAGARGGWISVHTSEQVFGCCQEDLVVADLKKSSFVTSM